MNQYLHTFSKALECGKKKIFEALKRMPNDTSPGNGSLVKAFFETFWSEVKTPFLTCCFHSW